ncbi:hypothetical protein D1818_05550 [Aquimarina sp. BL5]|uniref:hypothetical protein n=1 Tax=Aquimarina sp. BL5 TaxID=1714860 RepID=UPI000E5073F8|nr:hypothetical protein [Aquimarina sp. BL5]AXT50319.1 hypothetical protein D1818_05550 [Aquimarina sp. BL5]RKM93062.1 hypothetical protein D7036_22445 [Aquimarina sp. BL5]
MTNERKIQIAESFSEKNIEMELDIDLSEKEFELLKKGVFAGSMDEKWNIFILNDFLYLARNWTDNCIYKASFKTERRGIKIDKLKITRNTAHYKGADLKSDSNLFKKLLQGYLNREDLYRDDRIDLPLIKSILEKYNEDSLRKSIGSQSIELNLSIYNSFKKSNSKFMTINGLKELTKNTKKYKPNYQLLSLHISNKENPKKDATTFFFNQEGTELLGQITIVRKASR